MKVIISSESNNHVQRNISKNITYEINENISFTGPCVKNYSIEMEESGGYYFCFNKIILSKSSVVHIVNEKGMVCYRFFGRKLMGVNPYKELNTISANGKKFTITLSSEDNTKSSLTLKSIHQINELFTYNEEGSFDEYGRISYSDLKLYDSEASNLIPPVAQVAPLGSHGTGWLLGKTSYFITNAHVIKEAITDNGVAANLQFLKRNGDYGSLFVQADEIIIMGTEDPETDNNNDYALVSLDPFDYENMRIHDLVGGLSLNTDDEISDTGDIIFMPGYPGQVDEALISYKKNNDTEYRATLLATKEEQLKYDCYSAPGSSGSPVISNSKKNVLGIDWGFDDDTPDLDYIFSGVKASHIWSGISDNVSSDDNINTEGLSLLNDVLFVSYIIPPDGEWFEFIPFSDQAYFREFSGSLQHLDNYSTVKVKAFFNQSEEVDEIIIRLAQLTSDGVFNLEENHGSEGDNKIILVKCLQEDNTIDITNNNYCWVGLELVDSTSSEIISYILFHIYILS